jgi:hypothetical protein
MASPCGPGQIRAWRIALLSALGLTLLIRAFSYEDWERLARQLRSGIDLQVRAWSEPPARSPVPLYPPVDLSDVIIASPQPPIDPAVRKQAHMLPREARIDRMVAGPNGTTVLFYGLPLPEPPPPPKAVFLCAVGRVKGPRYRALVGQFDAQGRQTSLFEWPRALGRIDATFVQPNGGIIVLGAIHEPEAGPLPPDTVLLRLGPYGIDPVFQMLRKSELAAEHPGVWLDPRVTSVRMDDHGGMDISGFFTSVRGQPRRHRARLRADGSLQG